VHPEENVSLAPFTTLKIGGPARFFARVESEAALLESLRFAESSELPVFILGGGSNLLVADEGFPGLVIQMALDEAIVSREHPATGKIVFQVPAGYDWDRFVELTCEQGYSGVECLAGIPGLAGGTPVQNVGAYGQEVAQTIQSVRVLDRTTHTFHELAAEACGFAYRRSIFNSTHRGRYIVTRVTFGLRRNAAPRLTYADLQRHFAGQPPPTPLQVSAAVRTIRAGKGMLIVEGDPDARSAGSFFKNPVVPIDSLAGIAHAAGQAEVPNWPGTAGMTKLPAAWLLDHAGFHKGFAMGAAGISSRHTLALINRTGTATCGDIVRLRDAIVAEVAARFGVRLEQEPVFLGVPPAPA